MGWKDVNDMGRNAEETVEEIEQTRDDLARKVDLLVDQAKVEAQALGKKVGVGAVALAALLALGWFAKRRVSG
jgi:F0F1-type ATP synthase membrane subunit b/b'